MVPRLAATSDRTGVSRPKRNEKEACFDGGIEARDGPSNDGSALPGTARKEWERIAKIKVAPASIAAGSQEEKTLPFKAAQYRAGAKAADERRGGDHGGGGEWNGHCGRILL